LKQKTKIQTELYVSIVRNKNIYPNQNKEYKNDLYLKNVADAIEKYYAYLHDPEKNKETDRLMYEEIKRIRPDTLFIPCFKSL
jgi:hypothetical protein